MELLPNDTKKLLPTPALMQFLMENHTKEKVTSELFVNQLHLLTSGCLHLRQLTVVMLYEWGYKSETECGKKRKKFDINLV